MIFGGSAAYDSKLRQKVTCWEVYMTEPATPAFLWWSESAITFDRTDHPDAVPHPRRYPLVVDLIVGPKRLTKVLMDGGSGLNIMYAKTLDEMGVDQTRLHPTRAPFHDIMPRKQAMPLGLIDLPITFRDSSNYRMETLTFKVVRFHGTYHAILGHPCYVKFMAIPSYTYLKLKMPGPCGVITIGTSFQRAYECEVECCEHAATIIASKELTTIRKEVAEEAPNPKWSARSFEPVEGAKEVVIDPSGSKGKVVHIGTTLSSEKESTLVDFLHANRDIFVWKPSDMPSIPREVAEHTLKICPGYKPVKQRPRRFN